MSASSRATQESISSRLYFRGDGISAPSARRRAARKSINSCFCSGLSLAAASSISERVLIFGVITKVGSVGYTRQVQVLVGSLAARIVSGESSMTVQHPRSLLYGSTVGPSAFSDIFRSNTPAFSDHISNEARSTRLAIDQRAKDRTENIIELFP
jgi:hypothetical protein